MGGWEAPLNQSLWTNPSAHLDLSTRLLCYFSGLTSIHCWFLSFHKAVAIPTGPKTSGVHIFVDADACVEPNEGCSTDIPISSVMSL